MKENTTANAIYHRATLVVAVIGAALLLTPAAKAALGRTNQESGS